MCKIIKIPLNIVHLDNANCHIIIKSEILSNNNCWWIIDTGASKTVFDISQSQMYENLGNVPKVDYKSAGINGEIENVCIGKLNNLKLQDYEFCNLEVALVDLVQINKIYQPIVGHDIVGLIGGDFLDKYSAIIDYGKRELIVNLD